MYIFKKDEHVLNGHAGKTDFLFDPNKHSGYHQSKLYSI